MKEGDVVDTVGPEDELLEDLLVGVLAVELHRILEFRNFCRRILRRTSGIDKILQSSNLRLLSNKVGAERRIVR